MRGVPLFERVTERQWRWLSIGLSVPVLGFGLALFVAAAAGPFGQAFAGTDFVHYLAGVHRWLTTGSPYDPAAVASPYGFGDTTFLYPPLSLVFFFPFLYLPAVLWWAIPLGLTGFVLMSWGPRPWTWPWLSLALANPRFHGALITGNSDLWSVAAVSAGLRWGWPAALLLIKPSLAPLAAVGIRRQSWWLAIAAMLLVSLPFGGLWIQWVRVIQNSPALPNYSLPAIPWLVMPLVAWAGRGRLAGRPRRSGASSFPRRESLGVAQDERTAD